MDISNLNVEQLKALAYDQVAILDQSKQNLSILNQRINVLMQEAQQAQQAQAAAAQQPVV